VWGVFPSRNSEEPLSARLVVLVSGSGTTLQALLDASDDPAWGATVVAVGADGDDLGTPRGVVRGVEQGLQRGAAPRDEDDEAGGNGVPPRTTGGEGRPA